MTIYLVLESAFAVVSRTNNDGCMPPAQLQCRCGRLSPCPLRFSTSAAVARRRIRSSPSRRESLHRPVLQCLPNSVQKSIPASAERLRSVTLKTVFRIGTSARVALVLGSGNNFACRAPSAKTQTRVAPLRIPSVFEDASQTATPSAFDRLATITCAIVPPDRAPIIAVVPKQAQGKMPLARSRSG